MKITSLLKLSTIDYPGVLSAVIFTSGCNLRCSYCHNKELIDGKAPLIDNADVFDFLNKRRNMLDGLVITGGEPTVQKNLMSFLKDVKNIGYKIKLDTNGTKPDILEKALPYVDYVAMDYKAPVELFDKICKAAFHGKVYESLRILANSSIPWEIRTTLAPEITPDVLTLIYGEIGQIKMRNKYQLHRLNDYRQV